MSLRLPKLPIPLGPAHGELAVSYINRLATIHGLAYEELWQQVSVIPKKGYYQRRDLVAARLAEVTGRHTAHLAHALPELRQPPPDWRQWRPDFQIGCTGCAATHPGGPIFVVLPHHHYVCLKHCYWIGPPDIHHPLADLHQLPEVVTAQHLHHRILRRFGWQATYDAILTAFLITGWTWDTQAEQYDYDTTISSRWTQRARTVIPPGATLPAYANAKLFAAVYPEAVRIAPMIASPYWRSLAHGNDHQRRHFATEIGTRLHWPDYHPAWHGDAIADWMRKDSHKPPITPPTIFPETKGRHLPEQLTNGRRHTSTIRNSHEAAWFSRHGTGGNLIRKHRHLRPVASRADSRTEIAK